MRDDSFAPDWVQAVLPEEIKRQREKGWPDFHPEDFCHRCGNKNPAWFTDAAAWFAATAERARETGREGIYCPTCFITLHEEQTGRRPIWRIELETP